MNLKRFAVTLLLALLLSVSTASIGSAASAKSAPVSKPAYTICSVTHWVMVENTGWIAEGTYQIAAQDFALLDLYNGTYCDYTNVYAGVQFLSTGTTCAAIQPFAFGHFTIQYGGGWNTGDAGNDRQYCGVHLQTYWNILGSDYVPFSVFCGTRAATYSDTLGYGINGATYWFRNC